MLLHFITKVLCVALGAIYPGYASYLALSNVAKSSRHSKELFRWMKYWIVYSFFVGIETFSDLLVYWFPFYYEIKILSLLYLALFRGSDPVYTQVLKPTLKLYEPDINEMLEKAKAEAKNRTASLWRRMLGAAFAAADQTVQAGRAYVSPNTEDTLPLDAVPATPAH
eukprot:m.60347 g.60347  ORF g.60347 m.60347 type:complete len:167 (-) comp49333_c0_seq1:92-592(-)